MAYPDRDALTQLDTLKNYFDPPIATGQVVRCNVDEQGDGYTTASVSFSGGGGSGAAGTVILSGGKVVSIKMTARGKDYYEAPTATITGDGSGAAVTAILSNEDVLQLLIKGASNLIAGMLPEFVFEADTVVTETRNGHGTNHLALRKRPATSFTSLTIDNVAIPQSVSRSAGWIFNAEENAVYLLGYAFSAGTQNVVLTYKAGLPASDVRLGMLEKACLISAAYWYLSRRHLDQVNVSAQGFTTVAYSEHDVPPAARLILKAPELNPTAYTF